MSKVVFLGVCLVKIEKRGAYYHLAQRLLREKVDAVDLPFLTASTQFRVSVALTPSRKGVRK